MQRQASQGSDSKFSKDGSAKRVGSKKKQSSVGTKTKAKEGDTFGKASEEYKESLETMQSLTDAGNPHDIGNK